MGRVQIGPGPGKYRLPPLVGYRDHDPSKYRYPQYSMGNKLEALKTDMKPGPGYNTEHMTMYGKEHPPAYSLVSRPHELTAFQGPGPAAYNTREAPLMKEQRPPAYSMSYRHDISKPSGTPGPNNYQLPSTMGPKVPDLPANGAFSMSSKHPLLAKERSPGPAKYDPTAPSRYKNKPPAYSISNKLNPLKAQVFPAPSDYYPQLGRKGGYSFGLKVDTSPYITADDEMPCTNR